jgi:hypothetical protein
VRTILRMMTSAVVLSVGSFATALVLLATVSGTQAAPVRLSCDGEMRVLARNVSEKSNLSLEIDAGKVKVGSSWGSSPILSEDDDTLTFGKGLEPPYVDKPHYGRNHCLHCDHH